ncbi:MAG: calcium/sodium antiporter [Halomonas sp.]|nr:calcium/sodium antiporter [Halomonas sp.]
MLYALSLIVGIALLTFGGEALIRGAIAAARRFGISPLLTGLVIVGFGTSSPELVVSVDAAINSQPDIAVGNIVGSNIGNILLILGLCALISPMTVKPLALRRDGLMVVAASLLFLLLSLSGALGRIDAVLFLSGLAAYLVWAYWSESHKHAPAGEVHAAEAEEMSVVPRSWLTINLAIIVGLALLIGGSRLLLYGAIGIAQAAGIPEAVIGLTLVAVGTSLPELAVSVIAALRRHADVAVGNILGSNIFNVLGILGVSAMLQPLPIAPRIQDFDQWVMLGSAVVLMLFLYTGLRLSRWEGGILLVSYAVYVWLSFAMF